jgi:hypothetical protein
MIRASSLRFLRANSIRRQGSSNFLSRPFRRRFLSSSNNNLQKPFVDGTKMTPHEIDAHLMDANEKMKAYADARHRMKLGKLTAKPHKFSHSGGNRSTNLRVQVGVTVILVVSFLSTPFLGKKIAKDKEFREKWVPAWLDYTVKEPEYAWTRQELHDIDVEYQKEMRERAIRGDFEPDKLAALDAVLKAKDRQNLVEPHVGTDAEVTTRNVWDRILWDRDVEGIEDEDDEEEVEDLPTQPKEKPSAWWGWSRRA